MQNAKVKAKRRKTIYPILVIIAVGRIFLILINSNLETKYIANIWLLRFFFLSTTKVE